MGWNSGASGDVFLGGTGTCFDCGVRHKDCKCWDDVDPDWEEDDDDN